MSDERPTREEIQRRVDFFNSLTKEEALWLVRVGRNAGEVPAADAPESSAGSPSTLPTRREEFADALHKVFASRMWKTSDAYRAKRFNDLLALYDQALAARESLVETVRRASAANEILAARISELEAAAATQNEDAARLDCLEEEAAVRNDVGVISELLRGPNLLTDDGWTHTWHPRAQGLCVNMSYSRTVREAIDLIRAARAATPKTEDATNE